MIEIHFGYPTEQIREYLVFMYNNLHPSIYHNGYNHSIKYNTGYGIIKKIVEEKDMKDVVLNLRHELEDIRLLCEYIIDKGYESIHIDYT